MILILPFALLIALLLAIPMVAVVRVAARHERRHGNTWQPRLSTGLDEFRALEAERVKATTRRQYDSAA